MIDYNILEAKKDKRISFAVAFYFIASAANATMKVTLPIPESAYRSVSMLWGVFIVFFMLRALRPVLNRSRRILLRSYVLFAALYLVSGIMWISRGEPAMELFMRTGFLTFIWWIPIGVFACSVIDKKVLYDVLLRASYIISIILFLNLFFHTSDAAEEGVEYDMFFGFAMIVPTLFHFNEFLSKRRFPILLLTVAEILSLVLYANRGILLSLAFFIFFALFFAGKSKKSIYPALFVLLFIVLFIFRDSVVSGLANLFSLFGMESRTLNMALDNNLADSSGREDFWAICFRMISEKPILGWGLGGEFVTLGRELSSLYGGPSSGFATAHNGVIQLWVELGVFFGTIATFIFIKPIFGTKSVTNSFSRDLIIIYFSSYGVTRLISADGFYYAPQVAMYIYLFYYRNHLKLETK